MLSTSQVKSVHYMERKKKKYFRNCTNIRTAIQVILIVNLADCIRSFLFVKSEMEQRNDNSRK